jgi:histone-lysine N-methyltransferase SETD3
MLRGSSALPAGGLQAKANGSARPPRAPLAAAASCQTRRRRATAAAASPAAAAAAATASSPLPAAWPVLGSSSSSSNNPRRRRSVGSVAATATAVQQQASSSSLLLPPPAAALLPAVERALAAVAAAAAADGAPAPRVAARVFETADGRGRVGLVATADAREGDALLAVPEALAATAAGDAGESAAVADFLSSGNGGGGDDAPAVSELVALALWVMAERVEEDGDAATAAPTKQQQQRGALLPALPRATLSPVLWADDERADLLRGSPVLQEARDRERALREQWASMSGGGGGGAAATTSQNPIARQGEQAFLRAFCAVVATAAFLPSAGCFALVPVVSSAALRRTCRGDGALVDYDPQAGSSGCAVLRCGAGGARAGQEVTLEDGRPNGEFLLATGALPGDDAAVPAGGGGGGGNARPSSPAAAAIAAARVDNPQDCLLFPATLLAADRLYAQKAEILAAAGLDPKGQAFPVRRDALPTQLLSFLRLSRVQDAAQFARVSFDADVVVSQMNEYEVLQLLMGDCRERLGAYAGGTLEEECKVLQRQAQEMGQRARDKGAAAAKGPGGAGAAAGGAGAGAEAEAEAEAERRARERLAARLRAAEKAVLSATTDAVRRRLAPIRGIPTKSGGMQDPNSDLREIFEALEGIPSAPARALDTVRRWAKGEFDPDWNKR